MANYCSNCIAFFGNDLDKLEHLRKMMDTTFNLSEYGSIRDFVMSYGYAKEEAISFTDGRDSFIEVDFEVSKDDESYYFTIQTESAWNPNVGVFRKIISDKYGEELDIEHCSEEPGMGIFINTDETGFFFTDRYYLNSCINGEYETEYFESREEVLDWVKSKFPDILATTMTYVHKIEEEVCKRIDESGDDFFTLRRFSYD